MLEYNNCAYYFSLYCSDCWHVYYVHIVTLHILSFIRIVNIKQVVFLRAMVAPGPVLLCVRRDTELAY